MNKSVLSEQIELVSRRRASEILGLTPGSIYRYEKVGLLTPIRLNSRVTRYRMGELQKLIADHTPSPGIESQPV
jgi:predicted site-specific integrase-resolvase